MAEPNALAHFAVPFALTMWWTKSWLMDPIRARWRFAIAAFVSLIAWVYLAFTATRIATTSGGVEIVFGSTALAYVCAFMAVVSFIGIILGLVLWTEEVGTDSVREMGRAGRGIFGDD